MFYLLARIRRQVKSQNGQEGDAHARNDEIDGVEERFASHGDVERDVQIGFDTARVEFLTPDHNQRRKENSRERKTYKNQYSLDQSDLGVSENS